MNYDQAINWLFNQLPMYQKIGNKAYKADLSNILKIVDQLNHPQSKLKFVHVAGTNGKGSTCHMLASILQEAGYKTGLYTSPHLKDYRERIKINGEFISKSFVLDFIEQHQNFLKENDFSFFEITVGVAFDYFAKQKVDIAVIEVGLGGRLDSTNIITPEVSAITNIGLDHVHILGNTLTKIAHEKAGIIKPNIPCVIGKYTKETKAVFEKIARSKQSKLYFAQHNNASNYTSDLLGTYQNENIKTVLQTIKILQNKAWLIKETAIINGLQKTVPNTGLLGRWQILNSTPLTVCDTAHNHEGLKYVIPQILQQKYTNLHIVLGFVADKNLSNILPLFPKEATYYFTQPNNPRALNSHELKQLAASHHLHGNTYHTVNEAVRKAKKQASNTDMIYIGGSTFVVAEIL